MTLHQRALRSRLRTMDDVPLDGKRVLVRVDFNVSIGDDGKVDENEDYRIEAALATIQELMQRRCKILLLTHLGRPKASGASGSQWDLAPVHRRLEDLLHEEIRVVKHLYGAEVETVLTSLEPGGVVMLPNVRLEPQEVSGNKAFAEQLARSVDAYVNEAFSVSHRAHTSVALLPKLLPSCAGRRTVEEVTVLDKLRANPARPYVAIVSGAKISTKVDLVRDLLQRVDRLCVGGQIANVFLAAAGTYAADAYDAEDIAIAKALLAEAGTKLLLPIDVVIGPADGSAPQVASTNELLADHGGIWDIGTASLQQIIEACRGAKTILWNGPVGKFEVKTFDATYRLAQALAALPAYRVVGGGDTVNALEAAHLTNSFDHVSVGGGAMVAYMEGKALPGLAPLYS